MLKKRIYEMTKTYGVVIKNVKHTPQTAHAAGWVPATDRSDESTEDSNKKTETKKTHKDEVDESTTSDNEDWKAKKKQKAKDVDANATDLKKGNCKEKKEPYCTNCKNNKGLWKKNLSKIKRERFKFCISISKCNECIDNEVATTCFCFLSISI